LVNSQLHETDPELTKLGLEQAFSLGSQLSEIFKTAGVKNIRIFSSPFSRTLMTSTSCMKGLGLFNTTLSIDNGLCEFVSFKECPKNHIALYSGENQHKDFLGQFINLDTYIINLE
jgi:broad specificity phosphatase PhoE